MERETFLRRVRSAMDSSELPPAPAEPPGGLVPELSDTGLVERFVERIAEADGTAHRVSNSDEAVGKIVDLLGRYDASEYLSWDAGQLPVPGLAERLPARPVAAVVPVDVEGRLDHQSSYMDLRVGITGASAGLAESGSIVLECGPGRARMASLIPLVHIALLRSSNIVPSLSHWVAANPSAAKDTSNLVVITGPSRTADIEQTLNLGVHGPKDVHVVLLDD